MKWIKTFEGISEIERLCKEYGIENWTINSEGLVDVDGDVDLSYMGLTKIPINFGRVGGYFYCYNSELTTLAGAPREVGGNFYCYNNKLTTLEGAPSKVGGNFYCRNNQLWTFKGAPEFIGGDFSCHSNKISEIWNLFKIPKDIDWLNDHDAIRMGSDNQPYVILDRLNSFLEDIGKEPVRELKNYKTI
jgi:hypothetical protein